MNVLAAIVNLALACAPDLVGFPDGRGEGRDSLPVVPIVATAATGGILAWIVAKLRRRKRARVDSRNTPPATGDDQPASAQA